MDDNNGQMLLGDKFGLNFHIRVLIVEEDHRKNLNQVIHRNGNRTRARSVKGYDVILRPQQSSFLSF